MDKNYVVSVSYRIKVPIRASGKTDAAAIAQDIETSLGEIIFCSNGDYEVTDVEPIGTYFDESEEI